MKKDIIDNINVIFSDKKKIIANRDISLLKLSCIYNEGKNHIVAAKVDNDLRELSYNLNDDCIVEFIDLNDNDGMRIYKRSTYFIMVKAFYELFPDRKVIIHHPIGTGVYCEVIGEKPLTTDDVNAVEKKMHEYVDNKIPFVKRVMSTSEAKELFVKKGRVDRYHALEYRDKSYVSLYSCDGYEDYFYGYMVPDTSYINNFVVKLCETGLMLLFPGDKMSSAAFESGGNNKIFRIFKEFKNWNKILGVENVGALNDIIHKGESNHLIRVAEALHEKKIAQIADNVTFCKDQKRIVLIAGPSSSGKTTFAKRLSIQLSVNGLKPVIISLDDYFLNREDTPIDENGEYDFEAIEAIDLELFNEHLQLLVQGERVEIPSFNFHKGCRDDVYKPLKIDKNGILIIEGIHGLNERLTSSIPRKHKYKVYVSALTSMNIDNHNRIPTSDTRIIRRIVRDYSYRGCIAEKTIKMWPSVRRGEEKNIFPFQEEADIMFNSFLIYEKSVLKKKAEELLKCITKSSEVYSEAKRLVEFLGYFVSIQDDEVPPNSILREFIGGSCF